MGRLYYRPQTAAQSLYYTVRAAAPATFRLRPDVDDVFAGDYVGSTELFGDFVPLCYLSARSRVVHVGFDRTYLDKGLSHPLLEAATVGPDGAVLAFDPDSRNVDAINAFAERHGIAQLRARKAAAWKENAELEFQFDATWGPMSGTTAIAEQQDHANAAAESVFERIAARPLDDLVLEHLGSHRIDFLALTANGAEPEILEGAAQVLASNDDLRIGLALASEHFSFEIRRELCDQLMGEGWSVVVSNALHDPWDAGPFLWCCLLREDLANDDALHGVTWEEALELATHESNVVRARIAQFTPSQDAKPRRRWSRRLRRVIDRSR
ncbi:MAG: FkbM family methyltransferase [Planctomycetota bacterium]